ncbi:FG-GAP repeat-containing protein [Methylocaldum marinum]|uniref:FG-GAP repeat-containing protein n=1 Tax=Methylocaldum marinum TaxID=1432792 RepID=A0A250KMA0_9GAMM|nr:FG-GAP repeat-containing protein [Methylocaldum marinum]
MDSLLSVIFSTYTDPPKYKKYLFISRHVGQTGGLNTVGSWVIPSLLVGADYASRKSSVGEVSSS